MYSVCVCVCVCVCLFLFILIYVLCVRVRIYIIVSINVFVSFLCIDVLCCLFMYRLPGRGYDVGFIEVAGGFWSPLRLPCRSEFVWSFSDKFVFAEFCVVCEHSTYYRVLIMSVSITTMTTATLIITT